VIPVDLARGFFDPLRTRSSSCTRFRLDMSVTLPTVGLPMLRKFKKEKGYSVCDFSKVKTILHLLDTNT
jgi:hypothetical protein